MRYDKEKCPLCQKTFTQDDDVVVCPECGTPQHRSCYDEAGRCVNSHLHETGFVWGKQTEENDDEIEAPAEIMEEKDDGEFIKCPECGTKVKKSALLCPNCGAITKPEIERQFMPQANDTVYFEGKAVDSDEFIDEDNTVTVKEAVCYIQRSKDSYIKTFLTAKKNKKKPKFNISAFIFGQYWFFFRKMYKPGFAFAGINLALSLFMSSFSYSLYSSASYKAYESALAHFMEIARPYVQGVQALTAEAEKILNAEIDLFNKATNACFQENLTNIIWVFVFLGIMILVNVFIGIFANKFYLNHIKTNVPKIKELVPGESTYYTYLYAKGGVSFFVPMLVSIAINYLSNFIISFVLR